MFEKIIDDAGQVSCIRRTTDGAFIPIDANNRDYQEYIQLEQNTEGQ